MKVSEKINSLKKMISSEINEELLVATGRLLISALREDWKLNQRDFSNENLTSLRKIVLLLDQIENFVYEQKDFHHISSKEEIDETIGRLHDIVEDTNRLKIAARVEKEIRELLERKNTLPSRGKTKKDAQLHKAFSILHSNKYECNKCGANMVLREGPNLFFWGCSTFPTCWGKKSLTKDELSILPS